VGFVESWEIVHPIGNKTKKQPKPMNTVLLYSSSLLAAKAVIAVIILILAIVRAANRNG
jgi:hypothetical protein